MPVTLVVSDTELFGADEAAEFIRTHVVIRRSDLRKIGRLAKKLGFYDQLKALNIQMNELSVRGGWDEGIRRRRPTRARK